VFGKRLAKSQLGFGGCCGHCVSLSFKNSGPVDQLGVSLSFKTVIPRVAASAGFSIPGTHKTCLNLRYCLIGVVDGRASRDAACHAGGSGFDSRSRPDLRLVWKSCSFL
jgi:hypothetical protein